MKKMMSLIVVMVAVLAVVMAGFYYRYVTNTETPYDEVGITLHGFMPGFIQTWGCAQLKVNFADQLPPTGCNVAGDPTAWAG